MLQGILCYLTFFFFFSSRRRHTRSDRDWSSDVCSSDLSPLPPLAGLSYSASARNPFRGVPAGGTGCGVKLPNNSLPPSIMPFPLRSREIGRASCRERG